MQYLLKGVKHLGSARLTKTVWWSDRSNVATALVVESSFPRKKKKKKVGEKNWAPGKKAGEGELLSPLSTVLTWVLNWEVLT